MATAAQVKPAHGKSILMTPDPYHVPGYGGFCPQFKYRIGETFGRTTSRLLCDSEIASSGRLVLAVHEDGAQAGKDKRVDAIRTRTQSWGDKKLMEQMVPGYTGFIPKSQHHFGKRYAENCVNAICDFEGAQHQHKDATWNMKAIGDMQSGKTVKFEANAKPLPAIRQRNKTPLDPIAAAAKPFVSQNICQHTMSPYYMTNDNPDKRFVSGYTGFVPRARGLIGSGYPIITHDALNEFSNDFQLHDKISKQPVQISRDVAPKASTMPVYPKETGLVPRYTGHIPGEKFRYGNTFGHSTKDARSQMPKPKRVAAAL